MWNKDLCPCECRNPIKKCVCKKDYVWNPSPCVYEIDRYLKSITGYLVITCLYN